MKTYKCYRCGEVFDKRDLPKDFEIKYKNSTIHLCKNCQDKLATWLVTLLYSEEELYSGDDVNYDR